jgi:hypothetical protein
VRLLAYRLEVAATSINLRSAFAAQTTRNDSGGMYLRRRGAMSTRSRIAFNKLSLFCVCFFLLAIVFAGRAMADAQTCDSSTPLQKNDPTTGKTIDLVVSGMCEVKGATTGSPLSYYFHSVNIVNNGTLTFDDALTNFYAENIVVEYGGSLTAGTTQAPIGTKGGLVTIHLWGPPGDPGVTCIQDNCGIPTPPWGSNTRSMNPTNCATTTLIPGVATDCFYDYDTLDKADKNKGLNDRYFGHKVLALSFGGTISLYGKKGATYTTTALTGCSENTPSCTGTSWVRLSKDALPGDMSIQVEGQVDWQANDNIVLSSTDYLPGHAEQLTISGTPTYNTAGKYTTITLAAAIEYPHNGQLFDLSNSSYNGISQLGLPKAADMRAAVGLLSRSISIVSDGDSPGDVFAVNPGNPDNYFGGHTIVRQGFKAYQVQGVLFYQLGQGGSIMHYPVHFHMARQTPQGNFREPPLTFVKDSSVWDSMTRWMVIHATQGVQLARNVGYESIGHGYYLEDGTETGNKIYANLGVFARAAVANGPTTPNVQNPRMVPGILAATDTTCDGTMAKCPSGYSAFPFYSDSQNPSLFWIMNGMNDFQYNMAAGANTCGACYWLVPGVISGPSQTEHWFGYAGEQLGAGRAGSTPLQNFVGNTCSAAQEGFIEIGGAAACLGINQINPDTLATKKSTLMMLPSPAAPPPNYDTDSAKAYWPITSGLRVPTRCEAADKGNTMADCSKATLCSAGDESNCDVVVLNKFTTSFNWPEGNFAAVWLRSMWSLALDDVISDPQNAGINLVTSGGYDVASVIPGYWGLVRQSALIGSSQWQNPKYTDGLAANPYTSNAGPANPFSATIGTSMVKGLVCAPAPNQKDTNTPNNAYCLSQNDGVSFQVSGFGGFQRMFSVYDGPIYQDSNAYLNIHSTFFTGNGKVDGPVLGTCKPQPLSYTMDNSNPCDRAGFISGGIASALAYRPGDTSKDRCFEPNAAIGWKQPNGFYYAPAFHSVNLFYSGVDIRHFVTDPVFTNTGPFDFTTSTSAANQAYCYFNNRQFQGFTDIDRETVLNDDDGTLTGLTSPVGPPLAPNLQFPGLTDIDRETVLNDDDRTLTGLTSTVGPAPTPNPPVYPSISVNKEDFFDAPTQAWECSSDYPANSMNDARCLPATAKTSPYEYVTTAIYPECAVNAAPPPKSGAPGFCPNDNNWGSVCTSSPPDYGCPGVQLYRQLLLPGEQTGLAQLKRMMGQNTWQRSGLTANHGSYYINTNVSKSQLPSTFASPNFFTGGQSYDLFFLYTKADTQQTYQMYVNKGTPTVNYGYEGLTLPFKFTKASTADAATHAWDSSYDSTTGLLKLTTDMSKIARIYALNAKVSDNVTLGQKYCQPATMCTWNSGFNFCQCNPNGPYESFCSQTKPARPTVCDWSVKDIDCPAQGCPAFQVTFPGGFVPDGTDHRPAPGLFSYANNASFTWDVDFNLSPSTVAGQQCTYTKQPAAVTACPANK